MKKVYPLLTLLLLFFCCNSAKNNSQDAFLIVGDLSYTLEEVKAVFNSYPFSVKRTFIGDDGRIDYNSFRDFMLREIAFAQLAYKENLDKQADVQAMLKWSTHRLLSQAYVREKIYSNLVSEEELRSLFDEYSKRYSQPEQYHARHILITPEKNPVLYNSEQDDAQTEEQCQEKIDRIKKLLNKGKDFSELARKYSEDMTATDGGDLGYFGKDDMETSFIEALSALKKGEFSGPIKTTFGYHFVQLIDKKSGSNIPFEAVKGDLIQRAIARQKDNVDQIVEQRIKDFIQQGQVKLP